MTYQTKPGVCDCSETPLLDEEEAAIILYPSLGTPLLLAAGQTRASIFIAAPSGMRGKVAGQPLMGKAVNVYKLVDQHLRVVDLDSKQEQKESEQSTKTGTLFGDGKDCATAKRYITGWRVGSFGPGALISDRHGRPFATIAPAAAQLYTRMQDVYEIELDLSAPPFAKLQAEGSLASLAWMIRLGQEDRKLPGFGTHAEAQDVAIARFLEKQVAKDPFHFKTLQEFQLRDPGGVFTRSLPGHKTGLDTRLKSWHPVKRLAAKPLKLGHLSDVHVSVRHNALACSPAKVLEDESTAAWNRRVGEKVCNSFEALKKLFEQMAEGQDKADAVLFTGDLIDYNRNLNPKEVSPSRSDTIGEQWKAFNLLANIFDQEKGPRLYPRGLDDMLVYSLVREMYRKHKLPIIMTSGNHEAYQVPYGISARVEAGDLSNWAFKLGVLEAAADAHKLSDTVGSGMDAALKFTVPGLAMSAGLRQWGQRNLPEHKKKLEEASAWTQGKANGGMSRDHNMTIYEACLAYGPTYGHALTGYNFSGDQFDWFYALFTPLADVVYAYGADSSDAKAAGAKQVIAALGWGVNENFKNLWDTNALSKTGVDRQGAGILPRATESFSGDQLKLVKQARSYKAASQSSLTVASHFTIVSFDEPQPYSNVTKNKHKTFFHPSNDATGVAGMKAAFNHVNVGTCERNQATYLVQNVQPVERSNDKTKVDWHLSGHSHRSGVYKVGWGANGTDTYGAKGWQVDIRQAKDPGIHGVQTVKPNSETAFIVSSCGGPIGYQNLDGELSAWTGRPPAGTLLDPVSGQIKQVKTERCHLEGEFKDKGFNEKPRLCVALDYLHVTSGMEGKGGLAKDGAIEVPLRFKPEYFGKTGELEVVLSEQVRKLQCIAEVVFWVFESGKDSAGDSIKAWRRMAPTVNGSKLTFTDADKAKLVSLMQTGAVRASDKSVMAWSPKSKFEFHANADFVMLARRLPQAVCEVQLKKPAATEAGEDWARDMQCTDPWVFPVDIALIDGNVDLGAWSLDKSDAAYPQKAVWLVGRPAGERGEVPDWKFLAVNFASKGYIPAREAINLDGPK